MSQICFFALLDIILLEHDLFAFRWNYIANNGFYHIKALLTCFKPKEMMSNIIKILVMYEIKNTSLFYILVDNSIKVRVKLEGFS